jgi:hypothetical protein
MPRFSFCLGFLTVCLWSGNSLLFAQQAVDSPTYAPSPDIGAPTPTPIASPPTTLTPPSTPYQPSNQPRSALDSGNFRNYFTITASLREEYDDNIFTTKDNKVGSFVTQFSPSILVSVPSANSTFSGRYTFGLDYYLNRPGNQVDLTHEVVLRYTHQFSDRFNLDLREQFGYYNQPDLLAAVGTPFVDGSYYSNVATAEFDGQWTPLFGTSTTYSNVAVLYEDHQVAVGQNYDENTFAQDFRFAFLPKFNFIAGGIFDNTTYFENDRGYTNYTGDIGLDWQALPSLTFGLRVGATATVASEIPLTVSPYGSVTAEWQLGKRSHLSASYTHNVVPTDFVDASAEEADRFSLRFAYDITRDVTVHVEGIESHADYTSNLIQQNSGIPSFTEDDIGVDAGVEYQVTSNFGLEAGYYLSDVSSQENSRDYTRNQVYVGVRGTY